ncbi:MAG TPA: methyltransferase domain-containing protein [Pyrinomonadaceae bacterium]
MTERGDVVRLSEKLGAFLYDVGAPLVFFPLGGLHAMREKTLDVLDIKPGTSVLELGCGSGSLTALLICRGAIVRGVDQSEAMLRRARRRAPEASFTRCDILDFKSDEKFDRVLLAFVLHHMESDDRLATLNLARPLLKSSGFISVLDWAEPRSALLRWALHALLAIVEPRTAMDWIESDFEIQLKQSGFKPIEEYPLAFGAVRVVLGEAAE